MKVPLLDLAEQHIQLRPELEAAIGRVLDTKVGDNFGRMQVTDSVTNSADFRQAVRQWAARLRQGLDNLKAGVAPPPPA